MYIQRPPESSDHLAGIVRKPTRYNILLILFTFFGLLTIGLANLYSAAGLESYFFDQQIKHAGVGIVCLILCGWVIPIRQFNTYSYLFFTIICTCLLVVSVLGHVAGGAQRWIVLGPLRFQPSEMAKLAVVMMTAKFFYNNRNKSSYTLKELWPVFLGAGIIFGLIFEQPDFGTAGVCAMLVGFQLLFIRINLSLKTILLIGSTSMFGAALGWIFKLRPYQKLRILNLLNPNLDPTGSGYHSLQSLIAIGSGRLFGKGYLQGTQSQLQFLPERHTDFIFSVFAEEQGFWKCSVVFFLFAILCYLALETARNARDTFSAVLAIGICGLLFLEYTINLAMVLGVFPVVGVPLPFFSYGGSSMLTVCITVGMLIGIERDRG